MKAVVVFHLFNFDLLDEIFKYISNITIEYDLYITITKEDETIKQKILNFKQDSKIFLVENRGYDVGPFFEILNKINLNEYDYLIKLHTKSSTKTTQFISKIQSFNNNEWRKYLLSFLKNKNVFSRCLNIFNKNQKIGMIGNKYCIMKNDIYYNFKLDDFCNTILNKLQIDKYNKSKYIAGTIFIARTNIFKPLQQLNININDFDITDGKIKHGTKAHFFERIFGFNVYKQGYKIYELFTIRSLLLFLKNTFYTKRVTTSNKLLIKLFKIPIYNKKLK